MNDDDMDLPESAVKPLALAMGRFRSQNGVLARGRISGKKGSGMTKGKRLTYIGKLKYTSNSEESDLLGIMLNATEKILAEEIVDDLSMYKSYVQAQVSIRYFISQTSISSVEDAETRWLNTLEGIMDVEYSVATSEITGYLWTDESLMIGGHDLLAELKSYIGQYVVLVIDVHQIKDS